MGKLLRYIGSAFLFLLIISFAVNTYNSDLGLIVNRVLKNEASNPQVLKYRIYLFNLVPVGNAVYYNQTRRKLHGKDVFYLKIEANTSELIAPFFKASAILESFIDPVEHNPVLFRQKITVLGKPDHTREVSYDQKQKTMVSSGIKRTIFPDTQDPLSLMSKLRMMDFDIDKNIEMGINTNQKNYVLKGLIEPKEIVTGGTTYKAYLGKGQVERRDKNNPYHRSLITVWFLKQQDNIPVLIRVFASGFIIQARLVGAD